MDRDELLTILGTLRQARIGQVRAPHKPLLLLWLFGRFATGTTVVTYAEAEAPVGRLISDFGPPARQVRDRAAMPFVHLERQLWDLRDAAGDPIESGPSRSGAWLRDRGAVGQFRPEVQRLLTDQDTLVSAARRLLDLHFTPVLADLICAEVDLDLPALEARAPVRRTRRAGFAEDVLRAYAYQCAMCGFDGALGRNPVGIQAAHVRWHSQRGPDELANAVALCALHHTLFDLGVLGLTGDRRIEVSDLYVARTEAGRSVETLAGRELHTPRPAASAVDITFIDWHREQVFKSVHPLSA